MLLCVFILPGQWMVIMQCEHYLYKHFKSFVKNCINLEHLYRE